MSTVLLTGASGHLGTLVLPLLLRAGHEVRAFSRSSSIPSSAGVRPFTGDLTEGTGVREAVTGVDVVIHCASDPREPASDLAAATNLIGALEKSGNDTHLVYISIVGVDVLPWSYYRAKHRVEEAIEGSGLPWTIQRATQFHSFVDTMVAQLARSPIMVVPRGFSFQPVATSEVADVLVEHANRGPAGRATDLGGPEIIPATELARSWLDAHDKHRPLVGVPVPGQLSKSFRNGANLCPDGTRGRVTWREYLGATAPTPLVESVEGTGGASGVPR